MLILLGMKLAYFIASIAWLGFSLACIAFLFWYVAAGAGLQFWGFSISSGSVLLGWIHVTGFALAAFICFVISAGLYLKAMGPRK